MRFIGDVHAKFDRYEKIALNSYESIQVGDFGVGFKEVPLISSNHKFIRGNHDNPDLCKQQTNWIKDGSFYNDIFCIGGAKSVDRHSRIEGVDWWSNEENSIHELNSLLMCMRNISHLS